ncbi:hypothetical protein [Pseudonocardia phyllosphaerae]|uniref:hypothetical protein n=1 Tax=Pseudonocardia phyllosphaerae TaxID=3390502 RepID=UPI00397A0DE1
MTELPPDLPDESAGASPDKFSYMSHLLRIGPELDRVVQAAKGNLTSHQIPDGWLKSLARKGRDSLPSEALQRWYALFADEISTVFRAINTVRSDAYISASNAAAAVEMARKLLDLAREAAVVHQGSRGR